MKKIYLYYKNLPENDRWFWGDRYFRKIAKSILNIKKIPSGVDKVFINLCLGLDELGVEYRLNSPFKKIQFGDYVGVLGRGKKCLQGYKQQNRITAGIGLMTHPSEWPTLCEDYPVSKYLQHSNWANDVYKPYFGDRCKVWPVGINTTEWSPQCQRGMQKTDFLIYDKIRWNRENYIKTLKKPIIHILSKKNLSFKEIQYGKYTPMEFKKMLYSCKAMIFLSEHESQGIAYQECLSCDLPILAWDQGWCLDPNRFIWGQEHIPASSVPYFDKRCGEKFKCIKDFQENLEIFLYNLNTKIYQPRCFILENLTLEKCAKNFIKQLKY
jgi:hypothetical protein